MKPVLLPGLILLAIGAMIAVIVGLGMQEARQIRLQRQQWQCTLSQPPERTLPGYPDAVNCLRYERVGATP